MSREAIVVEAGAIDHLVARVIGWAQSADRAVVVIDAGPYPLVRRDGVERRLRELGVNPDQLLMRKAGSKVRDVIAKAMFYEEISDNYKIEFVVDTDPEAADMWRSHGLRLFLLDIAP